MDEGADGFADELQGKSSTKSVKANVKIVFCIFHIHVGIIVVYYFSATMNLNKIGKGLVIRSLTTLDYW
ncbi:MAG TPA: hypothetical protein VJ729_05425 [Nitrososphaeraceae archaeon]|nr:hypothetical protein [Nitrososphaeraceae archaeon]